LLVRADLLTSRTLADKRKYAIVIAFVVAAVLTPPDPISQLGLAIPTILLYEISIFTARMIEKGRSRAQIEDQTAS
jgi:sec-independent protein translocase protein TatC